MIYTYSINQYKCDVIERLLLPKWNKYVINIATIWTTLCHTLKPNPFNGMLS